MRYFALLIILIVPTLLLAQQNAGFQFPAHELQTTRAANSPVHRASYEQVTPSVNAPPTQQLAPSESSFPSLTRSSAVAKEKSSSKSLGPFLTTAFSLAIVLGLFAGLVWVSRRYGNTSMPPGTDSGNMPNTLPGEVLKNLGSTAIDAETRVTMLRCGNRIIVMAESQTGVHPLSEITDPAEVQRLTEACIGGGNPQPTFAETLQQTPPKRRTMFATA